MDLEAIAPILEEIIKESLEKKRYPYGFAKFQGVGNKVASGKLRDSIKVDFEKRKNLEVINVIMIEYAQYVQAGRRKDKRGVPISSLLQWIKERKIKGRDKKGRYIKNLSLAFAIQQNIKKYGVRPANFLDYSIELILQDQRIVDLIGEATYEDLINAIEGI